MQRCVLAVALLALASGCPRPGGQAVAWKDFWRLREVRSHLTPVEDPGAPAAAPRYLSIDGNAYFVGLPGIGPGSQAVVRVRVRGVFPGSARLVTVAGPVAVGANGSFRLDDFPSLGTFPLRGQPLTLEFTVRTEVEVPHLEAALALQDGADPGRPGLPAQEPHRP